MLLLSDQPREGLLQDAEELVGAQRAEVAGEVVAGDGDTGAAGGGSSGAGAGDLDVGLLGGAASDSDLHNVSRSLVSSGDRSLNGGFNVGDNGSSSSGGGAYGGASRSGSAGGGGGSAGSRGTGSSGGGSGSGAGRRGTGGAAGRAAGGSGVVHSRTGDVVGAQGLVDVDQDTRVGVLVEGFTLGAGVGGATTAGNLQVETLRVVLGAILVLSGVQGNDLVAQDVVTSLEGRGNGHSPAVVVGDQVVSGPGSGDFSVADEAALVDLEELKVSLGDIGAVTVAVGKVSQDGTVVAGRPVSPLKLNSTTGLDVSGDSTRLSALVADDVRVRVFRAVDEAKVSGCGRPGNGLRRVTLIGVGGDDVSSVVLAVDDSTRHITVASNKGGRAEDDTSNLSDRHLAGFGLINAQRDRG